MINPNIKTFLMVADSGSFSAASDELFISKVSIMNQINTLEKEIGVTLFQRTNQGVSLTEAGKSFYKNSQLLMELSEKFILEAKQIGSTVSKTIRIGTSLMRPYKSLIDLWDKIGNHDQRFQFLVVPFIDDIDSMTPLLESIGDKIDCFVTACGSMDILMEYNFLPFHSCECAIAMPRNHPLAKKKILYFEDLENESLLLVKKGTSYVIDELRDEIYNNHPNINIIDYDGFYGISTFNLCEQQGYLMQTLDIWEDLHPSLVTVPVKWKYKLPFGIIYEKSPSSQVKSFIDIIAKYITQ